MPASSLSSAPDLHQSLLQAETRNAELAEALRQATAATEQARQQLAAYTEHAPVALLQVAADGRIVSINADYVALVGTEEPSHYWLGRQASELAALVSPAEADMPAAATKPALAFHTAFVQLPEGRVLERRYVPLAGSGYLEFLRDATQLDLAQGMQAAASMPEQCPYPIVRYDFNGEILYANSEAWRLRELLDDAGREAVRSQFFALAAVAREAGQPQQVEMTIGPRQFAVHMVAFAEEAYVNMYLLDITDRCAAEARMQASEARMREQQQFTQQILDTLSNIVVVRRADGQETFANRAYQRWTELNSASIAPEIAAEHRVTMARVLATGQAESLELPVVLADGAEHWLHVAQYRLARPGGEANVLIVSTDVTEQRRAQETLMRNEKRYRDLMHYAQALIWTHDLNGQVLSANPALGRLLGVESDSTIGKHLTAAFEMERHAQVGEYLAGIREQGEQSGVMKLTDKAGQVHYVLYQSYLVSEAGEEPYVVAYGQEITERVLAEREMKRAKEKAEAAALARENFLANMSHEIRTPLNGILGMANLMAKTALDARQAHFLDVIQTSGKHLLGVINDVLDMAKISSGKVEFERAAFNLCDSMGQSIQPLVLQAAQKGLTFMGTPLRQSCDYPWVLGDAQRLNQILINLTANAVKFTEPGGEVEVIGRQLSETADSLTVEFSVRDTGPGIAADRLERIFESFTQAYADTSRKHGGTGLGLTISQALVRQMGGQLTVTSEVGKGSTFAFSLTLPKAEQPIAPMNPNDLDTGELRGVRVLLVEDNEINRDVARLLLEGWGVEVEEATNGLLGVQRFGEQAYDVVLMDIQMPVLNGLEATARLRQHPDPARAATPIVALTANAFREDNEQYLAAGMNACLAKPFDEADLYRVLTQVLTPTEPPYDLTHLRGISRGQEVFVTKIIRSFLANMPESLATLQAAVAAADWPEVARTVHHIKPNLTALRVGGVNEAVALLEKLRAEIPAKNEEATLHKAAAQLMVAVQRALAALPAELPASN
ncbi:PAS domain S-box protein [Hymenobacter busanensis]|uniref:histidine kinase n=1 Tax=Hymenobacter busanensis TaxID=2607656 RepID=A0A7L5A0S8_9BACT|nr:ATP-binding protein [Hymenobacter busanensis]KAA9338191.1 PAS domain S-box protein [Hymenobacter busanensis]QHJ09384.1 PAS domain S-box protein [Hymenobacter busanensis]